MQDALLVGFSLEEGPVERGAVEAAFGQFRDDDDREAARQIPLELDLNGQAVGGGPGLGFIIEEVELDGQCGAAALQAGVDPVRKGLEALGRLCREATFLLGRDVRQADGSDQKVRLYSVRTQNLGQPSLPLAPQVVQLKQPVLSHGEAVAKEQVLVVLGRDMGDSPAVALDLNRTLH